MEWSLHAALGATALSVSGRSMSQEVRQLLVHLSFDCYSGADGSMGFTLMPFTTFPSLSALTGVLPGPPHVFFLFFIWGIIHVHTALGLRKGGHSVLCD